MVFIKKIFISIIYYFVPCKILVKITSFNLSSDMYYSKCVRYLEIIKIIIKKKTKMLSILKVTQSLKNKKKIYPKTIILYDDDDFFYPYVLVQFHKFA